MTSKPPARPVRDPRARIARALLLWVPVIGGMMLAAVVVSRGARPAPAGETPRDVAPNAPAPREIAAAPDASSPADGVAREIGESGPDGTLPGSVTVVGGAVPGAPLGPASSGASDEGSESGVRAPLSPRGPPGRLPAEVVRETVREAMPFLRFCFEWQLDLHPELSGRVSMDWRILPDGSVADADIAEDALHDETVLRCFRGVVGRLRFPPPEGGGEVTVRYPFVLSSAPEPERPEGI